MSKDPAFLFYSSDFMTGTFMMSDRQVGQYIRLMCLQHQHGHLSEKQMLSICKKHDDDIWDKFIQDENGLYYNDRLEAETEKRNQYCESRRKNKIAKKEVENPTHESTYDEHMNQHMSVHMENENIYINNTLVLYIINYLNSVLETHFKASSKKTKEHINARLKEGYTADDFKTVIDKKCAEWIGTDMEKYLCPDTLFGSKFEKYLNQRVTKTEGQRRKTFEELAEEIENDA